MGRVLIVDDDAPLAAGFARALRPDFTVDTATTIEAGRQKLFRGSYDVVLLDLNMGDDSYGDSLVPMLKTLVPRPTIAIVSGYLDSIRVTRMFEEGILSVPKPVPPRTLRALVQALVDKQTAAGFCQSYALSGRELEVVRHAARGMQNKEIAAAIGCKTATVITYWQRVFHKTRTRSRTEVLSLLLQCPRRTHSCEGNRVPPGGLVCVGIPADPDED